MRSVAPHGALYLLRTVWPDLSAEGKYLLVQIVLRFGGEWVAWTIERLSIELGMSRAAEGGASQCSVSWRGEFH